MEKDKLIKTTQVDVDPETGGITWDVEYAPRYKFLLQDLQKTRESLKKLIEKEPDPRLKDLYLKYEEFFVWFKRSISLLRTKIEKEKKQQQKLKETIKQILEKEIEEANMTGTGASFQAGDDEGYMTPRAFKKKKKTK